MRVSGVIYKIVGIALFYRIVIYLIESVSSRFIPVRTGFLGPIPSANFDGVHYLLIAQNSYYEFQQAFFPLFPLLINSLSYIFQIPHLFSSLLIVHFAFITSLVLFFKLASIDLSKKGALFALIVFLLFPSAFFLTAVYTEGLFLTFVFASLYFARKERFLLSSLFALLASATRLVGIFLIPAILIELYLSNKKKIEKVFVLKSLQLTVIGSLGLLSYMFYLWREYSDPFMFISSQPAFGAGRSGGEIILLPQVVYRYIKIFLTADITSMTYWVSALEIVSFAFVVVLLYFAFKKGVRLSYVAFSSLAIILPTLSGTFSSIPRYALISFAIFLIIPKIKNVTIKYIILSVFTLLEIVLASLFFRGYFVS